MDTEDPVMREREGLALYERGAYGEALRVLALARDGYAAQGNQIGVCEMWNDIGVVHYRQQQWDEAEQAFRQAQQVAIAADDRAGAGKALGNLGMLYARRGNAAAAEPFLREAILIFRELGDGEKEQATLKALSDLNLKGGRWLEALYQYESGVEAESRPGLWSRLMHWAVRMLKRVLRLPT